jgi:hypothetical protein
MTPQDQLPLAAVPVKGQQEVLAFMCWIPRNSSTAERGDDGSSKIDGGRPAWSAEVQIPDDPEGIDQLRLEHLIDPSYERVLTEQAIGVCRVERPSELPS